MLASLDFFWHFGTFCEQVTPIRRSAIIGIVRAMPPNSSESMRDLSATATVGLEPLAAVCSTKPPPAPTLLRNALVPHAEGDGYSRRDVLIVDGLLKTIAAGNSLAPPEAPGRVIDCSQKMLLPGFFNGHTHSSEHWVRGLIKPLPLELWVLNLIEHEPRGGAGWHGADSYEKTPALAVGVSAMLCGVEALLSGCTAVQDHLWIRHADDMGAAVAAYKALGIRAFVSPMLSDDDLSQMYWNCGCSRARGSCSAAQCGMALAHSPPPLRGACFGFQTCRHSNLPDGQRGERARARRGLPVRRDARGRHAARGGWWERRGAD